jgi:hypothetical protein
LQSGLFRLIIAVVEGYYNSWSHSITHKHTLNMTPLDEGSASRKGLYMLNAQYSQDRHPCPRRDSYTQYPPQTQALHRVATRIGHVQVYRSKFCSLRFRVWLFGSCTLPDCFVLYDGNGKDHFYSLRIWNRKRWNSVIILSPPKSH